MRRLQIDSTDLETALQFRTAFSDPPRTREAATSPGDLPPANHFRVDLTEKIDADSAVDGNEVGQAAELIEAMGYGYGMKADGLFRGNTLIEPFRSQGDTGFYGVSGSDCS